MNKPEIITSRTNKKIKDASSLLSSRERKKTGLFICEGARLCADAAQNGVEIEQLFITEKAADTYREAFCSLGKAAKQTFFIDESAAEKLSDTASSQNIFCVCRKKNDPRSFESKGFYLLTDNVQSPDNLGALARSSEAFGAAGLIVCSGCDIYSPKALRASMGALLRFPVFVRESCAEAARELKKLGFSVFGSVPDKNALDVRFAEKGEKTALIIGNEGAGISEETKKECAGFVTIPMAGRAESLNAAAAGAVLLWEFTGRNDMYGGFYGKHS
ncbi:MAG: RNA methyltransferase [Clostridia bacterium]|nr:RNA methyltransferase [Clostridia bacterium]